MHNCIEAKLRKYEVHRSDGNDPNYLYDTRTHVYVFHINFCPWCGKDLSQESLTEEKVECQKPSTNNSDV